MRGTKFFLTLQIAVFFLPIYSQNKSTPIESFQQKSDARKGYIITNSNEYRSGFLIIEKVGGNAKCIWFYEYIKSQPVRYDKTEIIEFGNEEDEVYVLMNINNEPVFVNRLNMKEPYLYFYRSNEGKRFFYNEGNDLVILPKNKSELREMLKINSKNCEAVNEIIKNVNYNKYRLSAFYSRLDECSDKKIPFLKTGVFASAQLHKFNLSGDNYFAFYAIELGGKHNLHVSQENLTPRFNTSYGVFLDIPVFRNNMNFTLHPEFEFSTGKYEFKEDVASVIIDLNYLNSSLLLRYNNQAHKKSLFFDIGVTYFLYNNK